MLKIVVELIFWKYSGTIIYLSTYEWLMQNTEPEKIF